MWRYQRQIKKLWQSMSKTIMMILRCGFQRVNVKSSKPTPRNTTTEASTASSNARSQKRWNETKPRGPQPISNPRPHPAGALPLPTSLPLLGILYPFPRSPAQPTQNPTPTHPTNEKNLFAARPQAHIKRRTIYLVQRGSAEPRRGNPWQQSKQTREPKAERRHHKQHGGRKINSAHLVNHSRPQAEKHFPPPKKRRSSPMVRKKKDGKPKRSSAPVLF